MTRVTVQDRVNVMDEFRLWKMTWREVADVVDETSAVLIPVGSIEQHGYHIPLDCDVYTSTYICERVAEKSFLDGVKVLVAPPINFGVSWYHMGFPGTITVKPETFIDVLTQICYSLSRHGFKRKIIVNSHGGNTSTLQVFINRFYEEYGEKIYLCQWWDLASDEMVSIDTPMIHVEEAETSVAMAVGMRVLTDKAVREAFDRRAALKEHGLPAFEIVKYDARHRGPYINTPMDMIHHISKSGVVGDATRADITKGKRILEVTIERLTEFCKQLRAAHR
ncbi:MAG: creatininase family protein [Candidatus Bathyarchaeia archaeon]